LFASFLVFHFGALIIIFLRDFQFIYASICPLRNLKKSFVIPKFCAVVIPRNDSDEESCCKDFSLSLEMTVWADSQDLFELFPAKMPWRRHKPLFEKTRYPIAWKRGIILAIRL